MAIKPNNNNETRWWSIPLEFFVETCTAIVVLLIIAAGAVFLSFVVTLLEANGVDEIIIYTLKIAEYFLLLVDLILFICFVYRASLRMVKKLW